MFATLNCRTPQQRRRKKESETYDEDDAAFDEFGAKAARLSALSAMATLGRPAPAREMDPCFRGSVTAFATREVSLVLFLFFLNKRSDLPQH